MGCSLNLQPMFIRSSDEMDWPVWVRQPVIPRKNICCYNSIEVSNMGCYVRADYWFETEEGDRVKTYLRSGRKSDL